MAKPCPECAKTVVALKRLRSKTRAACEAMKEQYSRVVTMRGQYRDLEYRHAKLQTRHDALLRRIRMANRPNAEVWSQTMAVLLTGDKPMTATDVGKGLGISAQAAYGRLIRLHRAVMVTKKVEGRSIYSRDAYRVLFSPSQKGRKIYAVAASALAEAKPKPADHLPDVQRRQRRTIGE